MKITYVNKKVEKFFTDYSKMKKKLPFEWVCAIKKIMDHLIAADNFGIFLSLALGKPEQLLGYKQITYSFHVSANEIEQAFMFLWTTQSICAITEALIPDSKFSRSGSICRNEFRMNSRTGDYADTAKNEPMSECPCLVDMEDGGGFCAS